MKNAGFTLVELAIVLVIIGLIIGGVLVGQDLIKAAEIRSGIAQIEGYNAAVNTFRSRFKALPGDIKNGSDFFDTTTFPYLQNGNGNKQVEGCGDAGLWAPGDDANITCTNVALSPIAHSGERLSFWGHLGAAGLINGTYVGRGSTEAYESVCGVGWTLAAMGREDCFKQIFPESRAG